MSGESVDLDHKSIWKTIEKYEVQDQINCFEKVLKIFSHVRSLEKTQATKKPSKPKGKR